MSDARTPFPADTELEGLIVSVVITAITVLCCLVCTIVICLVRCSLRENDFEFVPRPFLPRRPPAQQSINEDVPEEGGGEDDAGENGTGRVAWDLTEAPPPPSYRNVGQYQNVDIEHAEVVRMKSIYRLSSHTEPHAEPETTSLPPDYTSTRGDDVTSERVSNGVGPQEMQITEGGLPPTYSTAQMELMARRGAMEPSGELPPVSEDDVEANGSPPLN